MRKMKIFTVCNLTITCVCHGTALLGDRSNYVLADLNDNHQNAQNYLIKIKHFFCNYKTGHFGNEQ